MIKLTETREITPYLWGAPGRGQVSRVAVVAMKRGKSVDFTG
jgi:hypothetical protein